MDLFAHSRTLNVGHAAKLSPNPDQRPWQAWRSLGWRTEISLAMFFGGCHTSTQLFKLVSRNRQSFVYAVAVCIVKWTP